MVAIPVMTAVAHPLVEARVMALIAEAGADLAVVRRCVDVPDMLAVAATGAVRVVLLSVELPGLDRDVVAQLRLLGAEPIVIDDESAPGRATGLGIAVAVHSDTDASRLTSLVVAAAAGQHADQVGYADPSAASRLAPQLPGERVEPAHDRYGTVVAVWGPTGAPGRSMIALTLADEAARLGVPTLLIDADVYGGAIGPMLGLLDEAPGTAAACRLAGQGALDVRGLARVALTVGPNLRVLTGISRVDRWPELRASAFEAVLDTARGLCPLVVVDCGFGIEQDEELAYDTVAPRRNAATLVALESADDVLVVSGCEPVSVARTVRAVQDLAELLPQVSPRLVVNRVRARVFDGSAEPQLRETFTRFVGLQVDALVPDDPSGADRAVLRGRPLAEAASGSPIRPVLSGLASRLTGATPATRRRGRRRTGS